MKLIKVVTKYFDENCYLIGDDNCYVIDPGSCDKIIIQKIKENFKGVKAILLTHGHFDHVGAVDSLVNEFNCPVYLDNNDKCFIDSTSINEYSIKPSISLKVNTLDASKIDDEDIIVINTPGHSKGSVCYLFKKENILFTGDTLFKDSIGRTDLYSGNKVEMIESLKLLKSMKENYRICPGHDEETTLDDEKKFNNYLLRI